MLESTKHLLCVIVRQTSLCLYEASDASERQPCP